CCSFPFCCSGLVGGRGARGARGGARAGRPAHHVLLGHGLATQAVRAHAARPASIGPVLNLSPCEPASDRPADVAAARRMDGHVNRWWLDPLHGRGYPADMLATYGVAPPVRGDDLAVIATPTDFLGVNYYFRQVVADDPDGPPPYARQVPVPGAAQTAMGWEAYPAGLEDLLVAVSEEYAPARIMVTESGAAWPDRVTPEGTVEDPERTAYLEGHLAACAAARERGVPLDGYFVWSLLDNFEWAYGYDKRFGLVHVDYATQRRTVKASGQRYAELIRAHQRLAGSSEAVPVSG
ncbi:family 1 glycosylhydrolase, partial [Micromonospora purpureochromogenes]|uniref:family 1 glycosylhydrolase n=1 Tax=Micromonospora purpureochromogenes TaxID=47872 RepID=UPI0033C96396